MMERTSTGPYRLIGVSVATIMIVTTCTVLIFSNKSTPDSEPVSDLTVQPWAASTNLMAKDKAGGPLPAWMLGRTSPLCVAPLKPIARNPCLNLQWVPARVKESKTCESDMMQCNQRACTNSCDCKKSQKPFYPIEKTLVSRPGIGYVSKYHISGNISKSLSDGPSYCIKGKDFLGWKSPNYCCDYIPEGTSCHQYGSCGPGLYCDFNHMLSKKGECTTCPKYDAWGNKCHDGNTRFGDCQSCALDGSMVVCGKSKMKQFACSGQVMAHKMQEFLHCMNPNPSCFGIAIGQLARSRCILHGKCHLGFGYPVCLVFADMIDRARGVIDRALGIIGINASGINGGGAWGFKSVIGPITVAANVSHVLGGMRVTTDFGPAMNNSNISFTLHDVGIAMDLQLDFKYSKKKHDKRKWDESKELGKPLILMTKTAFVGPVPVMVEIRLTPVAHIEISAAASGKFNFGYRYTKKWRMKDGSALWFNEGGLQHNMKMIEVSSSQLGGSYMDISASAEATMKIVVGPELSVIINGFPISMLFGELYHW